MTEINPDQLADANLTDIQETINQQIQDVGEILNNLFDHAENKTALWLKGKDVRTLASWIIDLQNIATLQEAQLQAAVEQINTKPEKKKSRLWRPAP